jgi:hypothetical protein
MRRLLFAFLAFSFAGLVHAEPVTKPIELFNGKDLTNFYTWLTAPKKGETFLGKNNDPLKVFTVKDGMIRVSGEGFGAFITEKEYENYHLVAEFKWGTKTYAPRADKARDSGILLHCTGPDGGNSYDKEGKPVGAWMESIECQMIEGGTGDFILVGGKGKPAMSATVTQKDKQSYFDFKGEAKRFTGGRINWWGRDPAWKDVAGFRGKQDVEHPVGQWNKLECICAADSITIVLNGKIVNAGYQATHTRGKIIFQSEGAELFFRKIVLLPVKK